MPARWSPELSRRYAITRTPTGLRFELCSSLGGRRLGLGIDVEVGEAQVKDSIKRLQRLCKKVRNGGPAPQDPAFCAVILAGTDRPRRDEATGTYVFPITAFGA